jgi:hypothetical protein
MMSARFSSATQIDLSPPSSEAAGRDTTFDGFLRETGTLAFLVANEDQLVYERYSKAPIVGACRPRSRSPSLRVDARRDRDR